jgi:hypothetical protein
MMRGEEGELRKRYYAGLWMVRRVELELEALPL